jgi:hypothetical protein
MLIDGAAGEILDLCWLQHLVGLSICVRQPDKHDSFETRQ